MIELNIVLLDLENEDIASARFEKNNCQMGLEGSKTALKLYFCFDISKQVNTYKVWIIKIQVDNIKVNCTQGTAGT